MSAWPYIPELQALWNLNLTISDWPGVRIAGSGADAGRVVYLNLQNVGVTGALPAELGRLTAMTTFSLGYNSLTSVPAEIGQLVALTGLYLVYNQLTSVPPEIGQLT